MSSLSAASRADGAGVPVHNPPPDLANGRTVARKRKDTPVLPFSAPPLTKRQRVHVASAEPLPRCSHWPDGCGEPAKRKSREAEQDGRTCKRSKPTPSCITEEDEHPATPRPLLDSPSSSGSSSRGSLLFYTPLSSPTKPMQEPPSSSGSSSVGSPVPVTPPGSPGTPGPKASATSGYQSGSASSQSGSASSQSGSASSQSGSSDDDSDSSDDSHKAPPSTYRDKHTDEAFADKYVKLDMLGEGGFGAVYSGYRLADNLPVAIKYILLKDAPMGETRADGQQLPLEAEVMLRLADARSGPVGTAATVSLLDYYVHGEVFILVMERPDPCVDLWSYKDHKGNLEERDLKVIMRQLVKAAKELEDQDVLHRDIKMENILVETSSDTPRVRLIDFGLSCFSKKDQRHNDFYGTPAYAPVECRLGEKYTAGPVTVWQLGVVMFDLAHDQGFTTRKLVRRRLRLSPDLSASCKDFLHRCLGLWPENRTTLDQLLRDPWLR